MTKTCKRCGKTLHWFPDQESNVLSTGQWYEFKGVHPQHGKRYTTHQCPEKGVS